MPEPITPQAGQPGDGTQVAGQEPVSPQVQPTQDGPNEAPSQEQIAQWRASAEQAEQIQQQLAQREQQLQQATESARYFQSQVHKVQQGLGMPSQQAAPDPIAQYAKQLESKGYNATQARDLAEMNYAMIQQHVTPVQQKLAAFEMAQSAEPQIKGSLDALYARNPQLFTNPGTYEKAINDVRSALQQGMRVDDKFVEQMTVLAAHELGQSRPQQVVPMQPAPQIFANGMNRPTTGYPPPAQPARQAVPLEFQKGSDFVKEYLKLPNAS